MLHSQISRRLLSVMFVVWSCTTCGVTFAQTVADQSLMLQARTRVEVKPDTDRWHSVVNPVAWKPSETCIVVCDMWDDHWCKPAAARVAEMAPEMNHVIRAAREKGVFIIHCPSDTMDFYKDFPQRKLAQAAPVVETEIPLERWCYLDKTREGERLPIDDSDGGCDCDPPPKNYRAWSRQHPAIEIAEQDAITDSSEAFYLMKQHGIQNVIVMGVHTNMCVLGRPFSIRQMVRQGQNVVLMRDMTDAMYNPAMAPLVSHFTGNDLIVQHIEQYWCPTITSEDFGALPFQFADDQRKHIVIIMSEPEYKTDESLTQFAKEELGRDFQVSLVYGDATNGDLLRGLEVLKSADLALISVRRRTLLPEQMQLIRDFVASGKPIVGIRTASHAFCLRNKPAPDDRADWPEFDRDVIGGSYTSHHGAGPETTVTLATSNEQHPILHGVNVTELWGRGSLYKSGPLQPTATPLLIGTIPDESAEPIAWINKRKDGGTTFYTSLGHVGDFEQPGFRRLLSNACRWQVQPTAP
jgi:nicotinamidase-related amidase/type 1 glutamine amidotransferase